MKSIAFLPGATALSITVAACGFDGLRSQGWASEPATPPASIERDYLVKGMTCGGCVFGVKKALERAGLAKDQIVEVDHRKPDPKHRVGHAKVWFPRDQYRGAETDCQVVRAIRDNPGYIAYWDPAVPDPCGLDQPKKN